MYRVIVIALTAMLAVGSESKGADMKLGEYSIHSESGELHIQFPIMWDEDGSQVKVWMDLAGQAPKSPPVMPYEFRRASVRAKTISRVPSIFDAQSFVPGNTYELNVKVEYVTTGGTRVDNGRLSVVIPPAGESLGVDRQGKRAEKKAMRQAEKRSLMGSEVIGEDPRMKAEVQVRPKKGSGGTEYNYMLRPKDASINQFQLEIKAPVQVTGTPKGWILVGVGGVAGITWMTTDPNLAVQSGKQLNGFTVVGSDKRTNVAYAVRGPGKTGGGLVEGPGEKPIQ